MTEDDLYSVEESLETALAPFRKKAAELRLPELRIHVALEAARSEVLKLMLTSRNETPRPAFRVIDMDGAIGRTATLEDAAASNPAAALRTT